MQMLKVRKRTDEREAMRFDGTQEGTQAIRRWMRETRPKAEALYSIVGGKPQLMVAYDVATHSSGTLFGCESFEFIVNVGEFIIKSTGDNFMPIPAARFRERYQIST